MKLRTKENWRSDRQIRLCKSYKNGGEYVWGESYLESMAQRKFEFDQKILSYKAQPKEYSYLDASGQSRNYVPDTEIETVEGLFNIETKPAVFTRGEKAEARFNHLRMCFHKAKKPELS